MNTLIDNESTCKLLGYYVLPSSAVCTNDKTVQQHTTVLEYVLVS